MNLWRQQIGNLNVDLKAVREFLHFVTRRLKKLVFRLQSVIQSMAFLAANRLK